MFTFDMHYSLQIHILSKLIHPSIIRYYGTVTENISHFTVTGLRHTVIG